MQRLRAAAGKAGRRLGRLRPVRLVRRQVRVLLSLVRAAQGVVAGADVEGLLVRELQEVLERLRQLRLPVLAPPEEDAALLRQLRRHRACWAPSSWSCTNRKGAADDSTPLHSRGSRNRVPLVPQILNKVHRQQIG